MPIGVCYSCVPSQLGEKSFMAEEGVGVKGGKLCGKMYCLFISVLPRHLKTPFRGYSQGLLYWQGTSKQLQVH